MANMNSKGRVHTCSLSIKYDMYTNISAKKMCVAKTTHFFFNKNTYDLNIVLTTTVNQFVIDI